MTKGDKSLSKQPNHISFKYRKFNSWSYISFRMLQLMIPDFLFPSHVSKRSSCHFLNITERCNIQNEEIIWAWPLGKCWWMPDVISVICLALDSDWCWLGYDCKLGGRCYDTPGHCHCPLPTLGVCLLTSADLVTTKMVIFILIIRRWNQWTKLFG